MTGENLNHPKTVPRSKFGAKPGANDTYIIVIPHDSQIIATELIDHHWHNYYHLTKYLICSVPYYAQMLLLLIFLTLANQSEVIDKPFLPIEFMALYEIYSLNNSGNGGYCL